MARTVTTGGAISGYCAIGSTRPAARPASTMNIDSTTAKIGRSMKNLESMVGPPGSGFHGGLCRRFYRRIGGFCRRLARRLGRPLLFGADDIDRRTGGEDFRHAVDDDPVARLDARMDDPAAAGPC